MKKILSVSTAFAILGSLFLCGCYCEQPSGSSSATASQDFKSVVITGDASFYDEVLQDYKTIVQFRLSDNFEDNWNNDCLPTISTTLAVAIKENSNAEWSNATVEMTAGIEAPTLSSFGYILRDINNDSFPELFLVREDYTIIAIFTNRNGKLVLLDVFLPKHECIITNKNELYIRTSSGALYTNYTMQTLTSQGILLTSKQFGFDGISAQSELLYYEIVDDVEQPIGEDRFDELLRKNPFEFGSDWLAQKLNLLE